MRLWVPALAIAAVAALLGWRAEAQSWTEMAPTNDGLPNPYTTITGYFKLPPGRPWGSTAAVDVDKDGRSIWIAERCGANSCLDPATREIRNIPTVLHFDPDGNLIKAFGEGLMVQPHGIHVDREGNVWVTDDQDNGPLPEPGPDTNTGGRGGRGRGRGGRPTGVNPAATKGHQVFKFSPDGKLLMTLGKPGGAAGSGYFFEPNDVVVAPNGDVFVGEGHTPGGSSRILKFDKNGTLIKVIGKFGRGPGEFDEPHALSMDARGRLYVGDRYNNRIQILDQEGNFIAEWAQFSRPSGVHVDHRTDTLYVADSESGGVNPAHGAWKRGIRIGSALDGKLTAFIPDPDKDNPAVSGTWAAEGVVSDSLGNVYGAEVGPRAVKKYTKK
jgi:DNA-binding beta-propeller fold protein YncE